MLKVTHGIRNLDLMSATSLDSSGTSVLGLEVDIVLYALDRETRVDRPAVGFLRDQRRPP